LRRGAPNPPAGLRRQRKGGGEKYCIS
jgi:hypothetical protein